MTFKERLSRWVHHRSWARSLPGVVGKVSIEFAFWLVLVYAAFRTAHLVTPAVLEGLPPASTRFQQVVIGTALTVTTGSYCFSTLPPEELE